MVNFKLKGNIKNQMTLILILQIGFLTLTMIGTIQAYHFFSLNQVENEYVKEELDLVKGALTNELNQLSRTTNDYAIWDDTYDFNKDLNSHYIEVNFTYESIENINIDGFVFLNNQMDISMDALKKEQALTFPNMPLLSQNQLGKMKEAIEDIKKIGNLTGYIQLDGSPYLYALRPIRKSDGTGVEGGYIMMMRVMDQAMIDALNRQYQMSIELKSIESSSADENNIVTPDWIIYKMVLKDMLGEPVALLHIKVDRQLRQIANEGMNTSLIVVLFGLLVYGLYVSYFWNHKVLHRLASLRTEVLDLKEGKLLSVQNLKNPDQPDEIEVLRFEIARLHDKNLKQSELLTFKHLELEDTYKTIVSEFPGLIFILDKEACFLGCEGVQQPQLLYPKEAFIGKKVEDFFNEDFPDLVKSNIHQCLSTLEIVQFEYSLGSDSNKRDYEAKMVPRGKGEVIAFITDITELNKSIREIEYLSYHDQLTGLYNRRFIEAEYTRISTSRNLPLSVVAIDVDGLKLVNDTFGHAFGDQMLREIGTAMKEALRSDDFVARMGGDEFAVLLPQADEALVHLLMKRISDQVSQIEIRGVKASISLGSYTSNVTGMNFMEMVKYADELMYKNKVNNSAIFRYNTLLSMCKGLKNIDKDNDLRKQNLQQLTMAVAQQLGLSESQMTDLENAIKFHDIGLLGIDEATRLMETTYNDEALKDMRRHSEIAAQIIKGVEPFKHLADVVLYHHEHWDGTGYPKGLKENDIPLLSRIIFAVIAYYSMTHERTYAKVKTKQEAFDELRLFSGVHFDPEVVEALLRIEDERMT